MEIISSEEFKIPDRTAVAIGKFDGIHLGHMALLKKVIEAGNEKNLKTCVFTFYPSAASYFSNGEIKEITTYTEKRVIFEKMGIDILVEFPLNQNTAAISPEDFIENIVCKGLNAAYIAAGYDLSFGYKGLGNAELLKSMAVKENQDENREAYRDSNQETNTTQRYEVEIIDKLQYGGREISSTYVREEIAAGHMETVAELLGHPYSFVGAVMHGAKLGRKLGFPTMNLYPDAEKELPPIGVYYSMLHFEGASYPGITNIGMRPTVTDEKEISVETYLYDFDQDMYGKNIQIELLKYKRGEVKFDSLLELKEQLRRDIFDGRRFQKIL